MNDKWRIIFYNLSIIYHLCEFGFSINQFYLLPLFPQTKPVLDLHGPAKSREEALSCWSDSVTSICWHPDSLRKYITVVFQMDLDLNTEGVSPFQTPPQREMSWVIDFKHKETGHCHRPELWWQKSHLVLHLGMWYIYAGLLNIYKKLAPTRAIRWNFKS